MSEVKRYYIGAYSGEAEARTCSPHAFEIVHQDEGRYFVLDEDFDRVTAERDAALGESIALRQNIGRVVFERDSSQRREQALQQRLTAADEQVSELLIMLRMAWVDTEVSADNCRRIDAALKPAEAAKCCTVSAEDRALLDAGDYTPEELFGIGGKPSCPKCFKPAEGGGDDS